MIKKFTLLIAILLYNATISTKNFNFFRYFCYKNRSNSTDETSTIIAIKARQDRELHMAFADIRLEELEEIQKITLLRKKQLRTVFATKRKKYKVLATIYE